MTASFGNNYGLEALSQKLMAKASARGWPQIRYRPPFYYLIDRVTHEKTKVILSNMACDAEETTVTVCGGRSSWGMFLAEADSHDLVGANAVLSTDEGGAHQAGDRAGCRLEAIV